MQIDHLHIAPRRIALVRWQWRVIQRRRRLVRPLPDGRGAQTPSREPA